MSDRKLKGGEPNMSYQQCCYNASGYGRNFLTKEEKIEMLKEYKEYLDREVRGVSERIHELEQ
jgi:hypothetical protein